MIPVFILLAGGATMCLSEAGDGEPAEVEHLLAVMEKLRPLHTRLGKPQPGDWLEVHPEPGQSFREYLASDPLTPRGQRRVIYIQPLGEFTQTQRKIVTLTADFTRRYFDLPVKIQKDLSLSVIPPSARRRHPAWGMGQILTKYVLQQLLRPRLPQDAAASSLCFVKVSASVFFTAPSMCVTPCRTRNCSSCFDVPTP